MTIRRQGRDISAKAAPWRALLTVILVMGSLWGLAGPAAAEAPTVPAEAFTAPVCEGTTLLDPADSSGPVPDLRSVFGTRLAEYNEGRVVPLYDSFAANDTNAYPPVCSTRYVSGIGPVSEWMFCTDYFSHVCSGVDADGNLLDIDGNPIPGLNELAGANPKLTPEQESLIAYLIQHGQDAYQGTGYFNFNNAARAVSDGDSWERSALQVLIWCISDPVAPSATGTELERGATCLDNMGPERQAEILASISADPTLSVAGPSAPIPIGGSGEFVITTDVFSSPLTLSTAGIPGTLTVVSGPGVLSGDQLQVSGSGAPVTVTLALTATEQGTATLSAVATPPSTAHIAWNQSPGRSADDVPCQVFATFRVADQVTINSSASATFATEGGGGTGTGEGFGAFSITKAVTWDGQAIDGIVFAGTYTVTAPDGTAIVENQPFNVAEGSTWTSEGYETGSTVHIEEILPTGPSSIIWAAPVFSTNDFILGDETTVAVTLTNRATLNTGVFEASKVVAGDGASLVADDAVFLLEYDYPAGEGFEAGSGALELSANGDVVTSGALPVGAVLTLSERAPDAIAGATWAAPVLSTGTVTIDDDEPVSVTVTNTLTLDADAIGAGGEEAGHGTGASAGSGSTSGLALTGGELSLVMVVLGVALIAVGGSVLVSRRSRPSK